MGLHLNGCVMQFVSAAFFGLMTVVREPRDIGSATRLGYCHFYMEIVYSGNI